VASAGGSPGATDEGVSVMAGRGDRQAGMRRAAALVLAGLVLVMTLAVRWRLNADPNRAFLTADAAFKAGRLAEADAVLRRLERLRTPTPVDRLLRGEVAQALNDTDRSLSELAAVPDDHPVAPLARLRAGQIAIRLGRTHAAETAFRASLRLFPSGIQPRKELAYIYKIQHRQAELDAILIEVMELSALDFAYILHWTQSRNTVWDPNADLPALEKCVAADPEDRWSRLALAEALRRLDRPDEADRVLAPLPASDPDARVERVLLAMVRDDCAASESLLADGPADHPGLARLRGQLALHRRDGEAAARQFRIAVAADPTDRLALQGLATALGMLGRDADARSYLEAARRHDALWALVARASTTEGENDPRLPHRLGMACAAIGRNVEARAWLKLAVRRDPGDSDGQRALFQLEHGPPTRSAGDGPATHSALRTP
jgi:predicted Zn-dependent protease